MATKGQLIKDILALEPNNEVVNRSKVSHSDLTKELAAAKRRDKEKKSAEAIPAEVRYRTEGDTILSWEIRATEDGRVIGALSYGDELPMIGQIISIGEGECVRISRHTAGLDITAGHLSVRERFDQRRIYVTTNGTKVTYKRRENGRVVLWSYKHQGEIAIGNHVVIERTDAVAKPTAAVRKKMTQKVFASWVIANNPSISGRQLTQELRDAFPQAAIGDRHGPHYLSLSKNGRLPEAPDSDPRTWAN